jgi:class 3 adenylate cyclase
MVEHPPSGTVTFLLTDLEASTRMWEQDPVAMKAAMVRHDELLEKTIAANPPARSVDAQSAPRA